MPDSGVPPGCGQRVRSRSGRGKATPGFGYELWPPTCASDPATDVARLRMDGPEGRVTKLEAGRRRVRSGSGTKLGPGITAFAARSRDDHSITEGVFDSVCERAGRVQASCAAGSEVSFVSEDGPDDSRELVGSRRHSDSSGLLLALAVVHARDLGLVLGAKSDHRGLAESPAQERGPAARDVSDARLACGRAHSGYESGEGRVLASFGRIVQSRRSQPRSWRRSLVRYQGSSASADSRPVPFKTSLSFISSSAAECPVLVVREQEHFDLEPGQLGESRLHLLPPGPLHEGLLLRGQAV